MMLKKKSFILVMQHKSPVTDANAYRDNVNNFIKDFDQLTMPFLLLQPFAPLAVFSWKEVA